jgi:predicted TIM-barrel fold metal-dependent hydrolase
MANDPQTISGAWNPSPHAVKLVDAHQHLWNLDLHQYPGLSDKPNSEFFLGSIDALRRNYLAEDYLRDSCSHNVLTTVHVEAEMSRDNQIEETRWLSQVNENYGFPGAIVAHAWFHTENAEEIIALQAAFPLVRGIRSKPVTGESPARMTPGAPGTMQDERWLRGFWLLERYGLSWDLRVPFWHLTEAAEVARTFPRIPIVLNHTGFPWDRSEEGLAAWRHGMERLAQCSNVFLKVSEFGLKDAAWDYQQNRRIVLDALAIFGTERSMFASNFPVAGLRIDYDSLVRATKRMLAHLSAEAQDSFFWRNACTFYRLHFDGGKC